ncbi:mannosyltransferase family protein [Clostridium manihotivorum]|uniref:Glycosyltransferase RgtA/B/C/D-like domain-containing protein n=1 Tax=Clostridium manihotivorum TaxID=2320868 RepID=A0A3R5X1Y0_9CLOT|nr:mannosyltransferase family protein [Clostridium manihotivorum]QAA32415.1 hypothetical protein C1I91_12620 [Clostridium manihotivorum]
MSRLNSILTKKTTDYPMKLLILKFIQITSIFLVSKLIILLTIHFFSIGPFSLITDHKDAPYNFITSIKKGLTGWDAGWYKNIVEHGYSYTENVKDQQNVAFYFGYPMTAKLVSKAFNLKADWALILVNNSAVFFGLFFMYYLGRLLGLKDNINFIGITLYSLNPFAIFLTAGYSEGMYFLISAMALVLLIKRNYLPAAIVGGLLSGIRSIGIFYAPILFIHYFFIEKKKFNMNNIFTSIMLLAFSVWGKAAFMLYNLIKFGDAFASEKVQQYWGNIGGYITLRQRFSNLSHYILIPFKNHFNLLDPSVVSILMVYFLLIISMIVLIKITRTYRTEGTLNLVKFENEFILLTWSVVQIVLPLIIFGTRNNNPFSMGRYVLPMFPLYILLGKLIDKKTTLYALLLATFTFEMVIITVGFSLGMPKGFYVF